MLPLKRHIFTCFLLLFSCFAISMPETQVSNWTSKAIGEIGESIMDTFYEVEKWEKLTIRESNPLNGLDGVFVKRSAKGTIIDFIAVESKVNSSQLSTLASGAKQGHSKYIFEKLDAAEEYIKKNNLPDYKTLNDIKQLKKLTKTGTAKSRLFHSEILGNKIKVTITPLIDAPSPNQVIKGIPKTVLDFNLISPQNNFERKIQRKVLEKLSTHLRNKGVPEKLVRNIIYSISKGGNIIQIVSENLTPFEIKSFLQSPNIKLGKSISPLNLKTKNIEIAKGTVTKFIRNGKTFSVLKVKFPASLKMGAGGGVGTFVIGEGVALYKYSTGSIDDIELKEETIKWAGEGIVVAVAIAACGSNPTGWVVLGVGIGSAAIYEICYDFSFPSRLTEEDLLGLLPDDLEENLQPFGSRNNFIYSNTSESFLGIEENKSALEVEGTEKLETGRESVLILQ